MFHQSQHNPCVEQQTRVSTSRDFKFELKLQLEEATKTEKQKIITLKSVALGYSSNLFWIFLFVFFFDGIFSRFLDCFWTLIDDFRMRTKVLIL
uniref:Putative ovule protein n=1 Tax=Solanum chacoense TaxID=4108 RepID=A0A0V0H016_SOLCH